MSQEALSLRMAEIAHEFMGRVPHNRALGMEIVRFGRGEAVIDLPYDEKLVGNPETGVIHGGAITALMDSACGGAVLMMLDTPRRIATLDLRIDYLTRATPGETVRCEATCFKVTRHVAFVRATAHHCDEAHRIAEATGTFVLFEPPTKPDDGEAA